MYQVLYQRGIGTQCSIFYIGWAHYYDSANAFKQAESVYNLGFQANAQPYSALERSHKDFRFSLSQRMLYNDQQSKKRTVSQYFFLFFPVFYNKILFIFLGNPIE